jgi:fucose permease
MFPTIFTITLERSSASTAAGLQAAFWVPMAAYAVIALFALSAGRVRIPQISAMPQNHAP